MSTQIHSRGVRGRPQFMTPPRLNHALMATTPGRASAELSDDVSGPLSLASAWTWRAVLDATTPRHDVRSAVFMHLVTSVHRTEGYGLLVELDRWSHRMAIAERVASALKAQGHLLVRLDRITAAVDRLLQPLPLPSNALEAFLDRMESQAEETKLPHPLALTEARRVWRDLRARLGDGLPAPGAGPAVDGSFMFVWRTDRHHLELEFFADGRGEVYYEDKAASGEGSYLDLDVAPGAAVPPQAVQKLREMFSPEGSAVPSRDP